MAIATALGWGNCAQMALAIFLAYVFGFGLTAVPLVRAGLGFGTVDALMIRAARTRPMRSSWRSQSSTR